MSQAADTAGACAGLEALKPTVEVAIDTPERPRVAGASAAEIRERLGAAGSGHGRAPGTAVRGVTSTQLAGRTSYTLSKAELPGGGRACVALAGISARFANEDVAVLFDRRYAEGSCERRAVIEHEMEHVRIGSETLRDWEGRIRDELRQVAGRWAGRWVQDGEPARRIDRDLDAAVSGLVRRIEADARTRNARIDTPESYRAVQRRCRNW